MVLHTLWYAIPEKTIMEIPRYEKQWIGEGLFVEMTLYPTASGPKFSLVLIDHGKRVVGIDNHENKPPHKHVGARELPYPFITLDKLFTDFWQLVVEYLEKKNG
ncbi:hypothetical protein CMO91_03025 [Candidatus Woesearchaeota archaeon]|jgi:hypothetical protein|nr:hypothetical protein [Candidatus Woesearchaeota archaeon]|tara:strand:+ start:1044 stop:1355 length:312 start_codon:yes stop_codon:yes gene_type:complete